MDNNDDSFGKDEDDIIFNQDEFKPNFGQNDFHENKKKNNSFSDLSSISGDAIVLQKENINLEEEPGGTATTSNYNEGNVDEKEEKEEKKLVETSVEKKRREKIKRSELATMNIPIFECFYCSNEKVASDQEIIKTINDKYLYCCSKYTFDLLSNIIKGKSNLEGKELKDKNKLVLQLKYSNDYISEFYDADNAEKILKKEISKKYAINLKKKYYPRLIYKSILLEEKFVNKTIDMKHLTSLEIKDIDIASFNKATSQDYGRNKSSSPPLRYKEFINCEEKIENNNLEEDLSKEFQEKIGNIKEISHNFNNVLIDNQNSNFLDFLKLDLKRKVKFSDISFDNSVHDIYNPKYNSSHESFSKQDREHVNLSENTNSHEYQANSNMNIISSILSSSELQGLQGQNNNSLNIKQDYILVNPIHDHDHDHDEKNANSYTNNVNSNSYTNIKIKNPLNFSNNDFSNYILSQKSNLNSLKKEQNKTKNKFANILEKHNKLSNKAPLSFLTKTHSTSFKDTIGKVKKSTYSDFNKIKDKITFEKDSDIILNMSGNGNHSNLSANLVFNDINKNFLCTSIENFTTKYIDNKKLSILPNRINTPNNLISSSDKLLRDNFAKTTVGLHHKKSEAFSNKSELLTIRTINDIISSSNKEYKKRFPSLKKNYVSSTAKTGKSLKYNNPNSANSANTANSGHIVNPSGLALFNSGGTTSPSRYNNYLLTSSNSNKLHKVIKSYGVQTPTSNKKNGYSNLSSNYEKNIKSLKHILEKPNFA